MEHTHDTQTSATTKKHLKGFLTRFLEEAFYLEENLVKAPEPMDFEESNDHGQFLQQFLKPFT